MERARRFALLSAVVLACGSERDTPRRAEVTALPPGIAAKVGEDEIPTELVLGVAKAQGVAPSEARERVVSDALFAAHARSAFAGTGLVESAERSALARALAEEIAREAEASGPPTDAEVDEVTQLRWFDFARPALMRTSHVVVLDEGAPKAEKTRRIAARMRDAVRDVRDAEAFEAKVKGVDVEGAKTKLEQLPPVATDGRLADPKQPPGAEVARLEESYAEAAHALADVPGVSEVIETRYGLHVILALERLPEKTVPLEERRQLMAREIFDRRARKRHQQLLEAVNKTTPVMLDRAANELLARVRVGP